jgi:hypothetical protein
MIITEQNDICALHYTANTLTYKGWKEIKVQTRQWQGTNGAKDEDMKEIIPS